MVGLFSRLSSVRGIHRRSQSAIGGREEEVPNTAELGAATHGIEVAAEFKPVEHPTEPQDNDQPIQCPLPEPSILNDGRIWKERSASMRRMGDLPVTKEEATVEPTKVGPVSRQRSILPSLSAPEHNILNLLEECNASRV